MKLSRLLLGVSLVLAGCSTPAQPVPDDVVINVAKSVDLAGTLALPEGKPKAAIVLLTGSGAQNRDEELMGHRPFKTISDSLTSRGYAVLRLDDRGTGASTGDFSKAVTADFVADARATLAWLRDTLPGLPTGLLGHSEGGEVAFRAAGDADFIVTLAAPAMPGDSIILSQAREMFLRAGLQDQWEATAPTLRKRYEQLKSTTPSMLLRATIYAEVVAEQPAAALQPDALMAQINAMLSPWYREMLRYNPQADIQAVAVPWLALNGDKDCQVVPENLRLIHTLNPKAEVKMLEGHNHLLQRCTTGDIAEYAKISEDISPQAMAAIADWLDELTSSKH